MRAFLPPRPGALAGVAAGVLAGLLAASSLPASAQPVAPDDPSGPSSLSDEIEATREQAAALADEIEEIGQRASVVLEEYHQAQAALADADRSLFDARQQVADYEERVDDLTQTMQARIVAMYQGGARPSPMSFLDASDAVDFGARSHYADAVADADRTVIDRLDHERSRLEQERVLLEEQRRVFAARAAEMEDRRAEVEAAMSDREHALAAAEGDLADLVAEEQRRREAEEAARAREAARRQAEEEARRRAATSTTQATTTTQPAPESDGSETPEPEAPSPEPDPSPADLPPVHPRAGEAVEAAIGKIGTPYQWGGNGPDSYDCSGLTTFAWGSVGVRLPRSSGLQMAALPSVPIEHIQPGDLLFFGNPVHHVGIYAGDGQMVNAPYTGTTVRMDSIWRTDFAGAGRPG